MRFPRDSWAVAVLAVLGLVTSNGCRASADAPLAPAPTDDTLLDASPQTKADVGVARWGISDDGASTDVRGYGLQNEVLFELRGTTDYGPDGRSLRAIDVTLTGHDLAARMHVDAVDRAKISVAEDTFSPSTLALRVVERIRADTAAAPSTANATTNAGSGPLLHTNTLQIRTQLLDRACEALRECRFSIFMSAWQYSSLPPQCGSNGEDSTVYSPDEEEANNTGCANVIEEYRKHGELEDDQAQTCKDAVRMAQHRCAPDPSNDP